MPKSRPIRVCVFGPNRQWQPSMDRFTADLSDIRSDRFVVWDANTRHRSPAKAPPRVEWARRWLTQPIDARRESADVFHVTDQSCAQVLLGLPRSRTVVTCHDLMPLRARDTDLGFRLSRRQLFQYRFSVGCLKRAQRVVANSEATKKDILHFLRIPHERIDVIPQGVDSEFQPWPQDRRHAARCALGVEDKFVLIHVGAVPYKNCETVVRVLAALVGQGVDAVLIQPGSMWAEGATRLAAELGVTNFIRPLGRVSDQGMVQAMNAADTLIFPSFWEGFGYPVAEAMSCGTAVVTSDAPALGELTGNDGLRADAKDVEGLTRHILRLANNPTYRRAIAHAGQKRSGAFTSNRMREAYQRIYEQVADGL